MSIRKKPLYIPKSKMIPLPKLRSLTEMQKLKFKEIDLQLALKKLKKEIQLQHVKDENEKRINRIREKLGMRVKDFKKREEIVRKQLKLKKLKESAKLF